MALAVRWLNGVRETHLVVHEQQAHLVVAAELGQVVRRLYMPRAGCGGSAVGDVCEASKSRCAKWCDGVVVCLWSCEKLR